MAIPKLSTVTNSPSRFLANEGVLSVLSASIFGASAIAIVSRIAARNPILGRNISISLIVIGVLGFVIVAVKMKGVLKPLFIGITASIAVAGASPFLTRLLPTSLKVAN